MRNGWRLAVLVPLTIASLPVWGSPENVDLILHGGKVVTVDPTFSVRSAIAVRDGKIVAVGTEAIVRDYKATRTIDLKGRVLLPGFMDTHQHVIAQGRRDVQLSAVTSITELQSKVRAKAHELGAGAWVTGMEWDEARFAEKRNPSRADLDAAAPGNPVMLVRAGAHSAVFNSAALKLLGVTRATPQPKEGLIEHGADGEPSGVIRESWETYAKAIPPLSWSELRDSYVSRLKDDLAADCDGYLSPATRALCGARHRTSADGALHRIPGRGAAQGLSAPHRLWGRAPAAGPHR
jgi:predicted amidohydrolase YtcJ